LKTQVYVTDDRYGDYSIEQEILAEVDAEIVVCDLHDPSIAKTTLAKADAILLNLFDMNANIIASLKNCRVISRYGVGIDNVDVAAATKAGIWVARVPSYCVDEVAVHTIGLLLGAIRRIPARDRLVRAGAWNLQNTQKVHRMAGRRLGIIGFGAVGREVYKRLSTFQLAETLVYDPSKDPDYVREAGAEPVPLQTLLQESDYVTIHAPLSEATTGLIDREKLALMKPGAILVNTARGKIVNQADLVEALQEGRLAYAALDVMDTEPPAADDPILALDNIILTDHCAYYSEQSISELKAKTAYNVLEVLKGRSPVYPVNAV
jgi:D-3-phosphoglycerate dehydrogenase / 2-oxoglutarate reductase